MRVCYTVLLAAATLLANVGEALASADLGQEQFSPMDQTGAALAKATTETNTGRFLRSHKTDDIEDEDDEERAGGWESLAAKLDDVLPQLAKVHKGFHGGLGSLTTNTAILGKARGNSAISAAE
ncbi:unnamed protein product [Phytophthora lilii]|uniref:RxLR effector protein n=1 Tax=Phytophthora lilii TaxID=2077276 RepID=A0A9W6XGJ6_9STRA|nr:unnamed protein product [Phytophthora lilii]